MLVPSVNEKDYRLGPIGASVVLVEYGDFGCPQCGTVYPVLKRIKQWLGSHLCFVYRHFPLSGESAWLLAEVAEAAGEQNWFWQMHDYLFEHQQDFNNLLTLAVAANFKLHTASFKQDLAQHRYRPQVEEDFHSGVFNGVCQTPTFFINGVLHQGDSSFANLVEAIEAAGFEQEKRRGNLSDRSDL